MDGIGLRKQLPDAVRADNRFFCIDFIYDFLFSGCKGRTGLGA